MVNVDPEPHGPVFTQETQRSPSKKKKTYRVTDSRGYMPLPRHPATSTLTMDNDQEYEDGYQHMRTKTKSMREDTNIMRTNTNSMRTDTKSVTRDTKSVGKIPRSEDRYHQYEGGYQEYEDGYQEYEGRYQHYEGRYQKYEDRYQQYEDGYLQSEDRYQESNRRRSKMGEIIAPDIVEKIHSAQKRTKPESDLKPESFIRKTTTHKRLVEKETKEKMVEQGQSRTPDRTGDCTPAHDRRHFPEEKKKEKKKNCFQRAFSWLRRLCRCRVDVWP
ncbi:hypothetical protein WMY93_012055 [Mugilogobius chulae]|uniref:Uncharacterized protein n=1 Tax=Mugilogobius chulae TaxID=88201 RepID=A0AAW0P821_9GOBI